MSKAKQLLEIINENRVSVWRDKSYSRFIILSGDHKSATGIEIDKRGKILRDDANEEDVQGMIFISDLNDSKIPSQALSQIEKQMDFFKY